MLSNLHKRTIGSMLATCYVLAAAKVNGWPGRTGFYRFSGTETKLDEDGFLQIPMDLYRDLEKAGWCKQTVSGFELEERRALRLLQRSQVTRKAFQAVLIGQSLFALKPNPVYGMPYSG